MEGIYSSRISLGTLDEAPFVYKDYKEIMDCIQPSVEILQRIIWIKCGIRSGWKCDFNRRSCVAGCQDLEGFYAKRYHLEKSCYRALFRGKGHE
mgnify:CR=1 FL=1